MIAVVPVVAFWIKLAAFTAALKVVVPVLVIESAPIAPLVASPPIMPVKLTLPSVVVMVRSLAVVVVLLTVEAKLIALLAAATPPVEFKVTELVKVTASL